jgi:hypothetical protein
MHRRQPGPYRFHVFQTGRGIVVGFAAQDEKGIPIHNQLRYVATLFQMGNRQSGFRLTAGRGGQKTTQYWENRSLYTHNEKMFEAKSDPKPSSCR